ncbi:phosphatase PAP2 family protein [Candidatus Saccharibacteria bacterium TM7i]|nr:phosphatase PAP2 family protein [Candidatus Saccharibacteria bacterium TM7i]
MTADVFIRIIADGAVIPVVLIAAWALLFKVPKGQRFAAYSRILMAGLTAYMIAKFAGTVYQPTDMRPFEVMGVDPGASYLDNPGFPSDHVLFVTAITLAVWFETRLRKTTVVLVVLSALVAIGRVLALVHSPLDVLGGVLFALIGALWYGSRYIEERKDGKGGGGQSKRRRPVAI